MFYQHCTLAAVFDREPKNQHPAIDIVKMWSKKLILILQVLHVCCGNWASEWMAQVQDEFGSVKDINTRMNYDADLKAYEDQELQIPNVEYLKAKANSSEVTRTSNVMSSSTLQAKLDNALQLAHGLATKLKEKIAYLSDRESAMKEIIAGGRSGVSVLTVHMLSRPPRSYVIRDDKWFTCQGLLQLSIGSDGPKCVGVESPTAPDPCVFNSVTKYETIPTRRRSVYKEDDFLCLKGSFNTTLEKYLSVPRKIVNDTCKQGVVRTLEDNMAQCGIRVLSDYVYYYHPSAANNIPREYCEPPPSGNCRLIMAWHLSNSTIEYFESLKDDPAFKSYFIKEQ